MFYRKFLLAFFFLLVTTKAFPATFIVTSNADSGPGTLREALTLAAVSDSTKMDYITFNLSDLSEPGRTITLLSQLPDLSSNLVIDGSTQAGPAFGISNARVQLLYKTPVLRTLSGLRIANHHDVSIYGLYINLATNVNPPSNAYLFFYNGIEIKNAINITIGDVGKGNVFNGFNVPLSVNSPDTIHHATPSALSKNLTIKDNFFGIGADGETQSINPVSQVGINYIVGQITIGGNSTAEGNLFANGLSIAQQNNIDSTDPRDIAFSTPAKIIIQNNKIGVDFNVKKTLAKTTAIMISCGTPNGKDTVDIMDNVIDADGGYAIYPINIGGKVRILRNYIGIDKSMNNVLTTGGIFVYWDHQIEIGSSNPADANYITNCNPVQVWPYCNVTINKNSFFCTKNTAPMHYSGYGSFTIPVVDISSYSSTSLSGTATPNSTIELFYSDYCGTCSPQTYFASVITDNSGNWNYNGIITGTVIASATLNNNTSDFTHPSIVTTNVKIINACTGGTGSITGLIPKSASNIKWLDVTGKIVGTSPDLLNVKIGKYKLLAQNGDCADSTAYFEIKNKFEFDVTNLKKINPSCSNSSGSITGLQIFSSQQSTITWIDAGGKIWSNTLILTNAPPGQYTAVVTAADGSCTQTYGPVTLTNTTGPNIDQSNSVITGSNCGTSTGSITNLLPTGTGTLTYTWKNAQQQVVAATKDLLNQPAGKYTLQVTDQSSCGSVYSSEITIPELNGITMDESQVANTPATCSNNNGAITNIKVTGATSYQWFNSANIQVGNTNNLLNALPGTYHLVASNSTCSKQSANYTILNIPGSITYPLTKTLINATCGLNNGSIKAIFTSAQPKGVRWVDASGQTAGNNALLDNIDAGTYKLYVTDDNNCESYLLSYSIQRVPQLQFDAASASVNNDNCNLQTASITGAKATAGLPPYTYTWLDANNKIIANTADVSHLNAGTYTLQITDAVKCATISNTYTITNQSSIIPAPSVNNLQLCGPGSALISVNNPSSVYQYRLYASADATLPIAEQSSSQFKVTINKNTEYYISQLSGSCESNRVLVKVNIGLTAVNIVNTFTPNGDGLNDTWKIEGMENYPTAKVQVFNRSGQTVFESTGYSVAFNGNVNGKPLPTGVYYYLINLNSKCDLISGTLTIIK